MRLELDNWKDLLVEILWNIKYNILHLTETFSQLIQWSHS